MRGLRKFGVLVLLYAGAFSLRAQSTACPNWTKTDCNGVTKTLYNYLDSNQVVALLFGMGCQSCTDAATFFSNLRSQYMATHPNRFKVFYLDFFAGNTCANNVTPIVGTSLDAGFDNCANELAAYTSASPMTYVVVVAGSSHSIIYSIKKYIFDYQDSVGIKNAIDGYFNAVGINELSKSEKRVHVFPNPCQNSLTVQGVAEPIVSYSLIDTKDLVVRHLTGLAATHMGIDLTDVKPGMYSLRVNYASGNREYFKVLKQE